MLRKQWLGTAGVMLIFSALQYFRSSHPVLDSVAALVIYGLVAGLVLRFGLLALATFIFVDSLVTYTQVTTNTSAWYFGNDVLLLATILTLAAWGFRTSIAGRRLWKQDLLD